MSYYICKYIITNGYAYIFCSNLLCYKYLIPGEVERLRGAAEAPSTVTHWNRDEPADPTRP